MKKKKKHVWQCHIGKTELHKNSVCFHTVFNITHFLHQLCTLFHTFYLKLRKRNLKYSLVKDIISTNPYFGGQDHI
jgi:hypothetical protein